MKKKKSSCRKLVSGHLYKGLIRTEKESKVSTTDGHSFEALLRREDRHTLTFETERSYLVLFKHAMTTLTCAPPVMKFFTYIDADDNENPNTEGRSLF